MWLRLIIRSTKRDISKHDLPLDSFFNPGHIKCYSELKFLECLLSAWHCLISFNLSL